MAIINKEYFYKYSPFPKNFDLTEIWNYVTMAEKLYIIPVIGQDLFDEINEQIKNNNLSDENSTLLTDGCLWQLLGFATAYESLPLTWSKISEAGIQLGKSDSSDSVSLKDLTLIQSHLQNQINGLRDYVIKFLCSHVDSYPLFDTSICDGCGCGCGKKKTQQLFKPINPTLRSNKNIR